jgi:hypothetical protein
MARLSSDTLLRAASCALLASALALMAAGCDRDGATDAAPAVPASSDPKGMDIVEGAILVAEEAGGGYRVLKMVHIDDYPEPIGYELHFIAFDPKVDSFEAGAKLWARDKGKLKVALDHVYVRKVNFMRRAYRVAAVEPVTKEERKAYEDAIRQR